MKSLPVSYCWANYLNFSNFRKRKPKAISDDEGEAPKVATNSDKKPNESGNDDLRTLMGEENKNFYDVIEMADALQPKVHNNKSNLFQFNPILSDLIYRETLWTLQLSKLQFLFCSNILYVNTNISVRTITCIDIEILLF